MISSNRDVQAARRITVDTPETFGIPPIRYFYTLLPSQKEYNYNRR